MTDFVLDNGGNNEMANLMNLDELLYQLECHVMTNYAKHLLCPPQKAKSLMLSHLILTSLKKKNKGFSSQLQYYPFPSISCAATHAMPDLGAVAGQDLPEAHPAVVLHVLHVLLGQVVDDGLEDVGPLGLKGIDEAAACLAQRHGPLFIHPIQVNFLGPFIEFHTEHFEDDVNLSVSSMNCSPKKCEKKLARMLYGKLENAISVLKVMFKKIK